MVTEQTVCEFLKQLIDEIRQLAPPNSFKWQKIKIERETNGYKLTGSDRPDFSVLVDFQHHKKPFASVVTFAKSVGCDPRYLTIRNRSTQYYGGDGWHWIQPDVVAIQLARDYLKTTEGLDYVEPLALPLASEFVRSLERSTSVIICFCVLRGLEIEFEEYDLGNEIRLRKLTDDQAIELFGGYDHRLYFDLLSRPPAIAEIRYEFPAGHQESDLLNRSTVKFDTLLTALRLLKPGNIERTGVWEKKERLGQLPSLDVYQGMASERFRPSTTYHLKEAEVKLLLNLLQFLEKGVAHERLQTAINRVNFAASRERLIDQILDLMIALESLFGDESGAIGYKIGMRCSKFVETELSARHELNEFIGQIFKQRHKIVHGGTGGVKEASAARTNQLLQVVQKSIDQFIKHLASTGKIPEARDFDAMLLK